MKQEKENILTKEAIEKRYENLTLKDDFMFGKVMQDEQNCIDMLERLTGNRIERIRTVVKQKAVQVTNDSKGVRYDVYVEDEKDNVYDAEMQQSYKNKVLPRRTRFYQGMMDLNMLESGSEYGELKNSFVIFICTYDPFGQDMACYEFENICKDNQKLFLNDGRKILFFYTKGKNINVCKEIADFLRFIETNKASDDYTKRLSRDVEMARMNKEWRVEYMKTLLHDYDVRRDGVAEGMSQAIMIILQKYGNVSDDLENKICSETNMEILNGWVNLATNCSTIKEFEERM